MNPSFISQRPGWCAACALALGFAFGTAQANDVRPGAQIWKNTDGVWCWNREFVAANPPANCGDPNVIAQSVVPAPFVSALAAPVQLQAVAPVVAPSPVRTQYVAPVAAPVATARAPRMDRN
jgi:hypothetical protein